MPVQTRRQTRPSALMRLPLEIFDIIWQYAEPTLQMHHLERFPAPGGNLLIIHSPPPPVSLAVCKKSRQAALRRRYQLFPRTFFCPDDQSEPSPGDDYVVCDSANDVLYVGNPGHLEKNPWEAFRFIMVEWSKDNRHIIAQFPNAKKIIYGVRLTPHMVDRRLLPCGKAECSPRLDVLSISGDPYFPENPKWMAEASTAHSRPGDAIGIPFFEMQKLYGESVNLHEEASSHASELSLLAGFCLIRAVCQCPRKAGYSDPCCPRFWESDTHSESGLDWAGCNLVCCSVMDP